MTFPSAAWPACGAGSVTPGADVPGDDRQYAAAILRAPAVGAEERERGPGGEISLG
jgi:hypothetical protein